MLYYNIIILYYLSLYIIKTFRRRPRVKNREGEGEGGRGPGGRIILSPPKARNFWVCSKFGFVQSLGLFEHRVSSKFGFVRLHRFGDLADRGEWKQIDEEGRGKEWITEIERVRRERSASEREEEQE